MRRWISCGVAFITILGFMELRSVICCLFVLFVTVIRANRAIPVIYAPHFMHAIDFIEVIHVINAIHLIDSIIHLFIDLIIAIKCVQFFIKYLTSF